MSGTVALCLVTVALAQPQSQSLFDPPAFREDRFTLAVDAGAHASGAATGPALALTLLPLPALAAPLLEVRLKGPGGPAYGWYLVEAGRPQEAIAYLTGPEQAVAYLRAGQPEQARRLLATLPDGPSSWWLQAHLAEANRQPLEAARLFARAADASVRYRIDQVDHLLQHGAPKAALELLGDKPRGTLLLLHHGRAQFALGDAAGAMASFQAARLSEPDDNRPLEMLVALIEAAPALAAQVAPLLADPQNDRARYALALALLRGGGDERSRAEGLLRQAAPREPACWFELGRLLSDRGDSAGAIAMFQAALEHAPSREMAHYRLARLMAAAGKAGQAERHRLSYQMLHKERLAREEAERRSRQLFLERF